MTKIEWTERTWNPIVGCSIVSPGCTNCYAMRMAARLEAMSSTQFPQHQGTTQPSKAGPVWTGKVALAPDATLRQPLHRRKPSMYFVNSMGDLFHEDVPDAWIDKVFAVMALCPQHTFQVLTKRADRMRRYVSSFRDDGQGFITRDGVDGYKPGVVCFNPKRWPLPNVWLGVSAERQQEADARIHDLLRTPAAVRFVSCEPLLGQVDLKRIDVPDYGFLNALDDGWFTDGRPPRRRLDWVIAGGESGPGARPMHPDWARALRDQCQGAGVAFFFKQWGEWAPSFGQIDVKRAAVSVHDGQRFEIEANERPRIFDMLDRATMKRVGKSRAGRLLDGREWNEMPTPQRTMEPA